METGDTARIWNPDGASILRQVVLMEGTVPGCVGLAEGGTIDLDESDPDHWIDRGGSANVITPAVRSNYMPGLSGYGNGIVNIEKYDGEPVLPPCERDLFSIGMSPRRVHRYQTGVYPAVQGFSTSVSCNHCEIPALPEAGATSPNLLIKVREAATAADYREVTY